MLGLFFKKFCALTFFKKQNIFNESIKISPVYTCMQLYPGIIVCNYMPEQLYAGGKVFLKLTRQPSRVPLHDLICLDVKSNSTSRASRVPLRQLITRSQERMKLANSSLAYYKALLM